MFSSTNISNFFVSTSVGNFFIHVYILNSENSQRVADLCPVFVGQLTIRLSIPFLVELPVHETMRTKRSSYSYGRTMVA